MIIIDQVSLGAVLARRLVFVISRPFLLLMHLLLSTFGLDSLENVKFAQVTQIVEKILRNLHSLFRVEQGFLVTV